MGRPWVSSATSKSGEQEGTSLTDGANKRIAQLTSAGFCSSSHATCSSSCRASSRSLAANHRCTRSPYRERQRQPQQHLPQRLHRQRSPNPQDHPQPPLRVGTHEKDHRLHPQHLLGLANQLQRKGHRQVHLQSRRSLASRPRVDSPLWNIHRQAARTLSRTAVAHRCMLVNRVVLQACSAQALSRVLMLECSLLRLCLLCRLISLIPTVSRRIMTLILRSITPIIALNMPDLLHRIILPKALHHHNNDSLGTRLRPRTCISPVNQHSMASIVSHKRRLRPPSISTRNSNINLSIRKLSMIPHNRLHRLLYRRTTPDLVPYSSEHAVHQHQICSTRLRTTPRLLLPPVLLWTTGAPACRHPDLQIQNF